MNTEICRCCLKRGGKLFPIYNSDDFDSTKDCLADMMKQITSVKPELDDKLPDQACIFCINDIRRFYDFKIMCELSNKRLQQLIFYGLEVKLEDSPLNINVNCKNDDLYQSTNAASFEDEKCRCVICNKDLLNNYELTKHLESHEKPYSCISCNSVFSEYLTLSKHIIDVHTSNNNLCDTNYLITELKEPNTSTKLHAGKHCPKRYAAIGESRENSRKHNGKKPFKCKCNYCDKKFTDNHLRMIHERTHTGEKPFKCNFCDKSFMRTDARIIHERIHTGERPFKCSYCDESFMYAHVRINHERDHTGERPFKCSYCNKCFKIANLRKVHERIHTGEKPFKCNFCDKRFPQPHTRIIHERIHTGERPFKCSYCEKSFITSSNSKQHEIRYHSAIKRQFQCKYCDESFKTAYFRQIHERKHTPEQL